MKTALIMEGGAMRGLFTCGVMDVFMENHITFDGAAGISAGAVFGCNYKSHQIGRPLRYNKKYCGDPRYGSMKSWLKTGNIYDEQFAYHDLPEKLDPFDVKTFREDPMEFWIGATNAETGKEVYHLCTDGGSKDIDWMRASASIPVLSKIVEIDGYKLLDGGSAVPVPYRFMMEEQGYDRSITILTQPAGFIKQKQSNMTAIRLFLRKYPAMIHTLEHRHEVYNELYRHIEEQESCGKTLIIRPQLPLGVGSSCKDPDELERVYQEGRAEASLQLSRVIEYLKK